MKNCAVGGCRVVVALKVDTVLNVSLSLHFYGVSPQSVHVPILINGCQVP